MRVPTEHFDSVPVYTLSPLSPEEIKEVLLPYESTGKNCVEEEDADSHYF